MTRQGGLELISPLACSRAWYDERVSGLDWTCLNPISSPISRPLDAAMEVLT